MEVRVKAECEYCKGTGLYSGFCEPKGTAVVCQGCAGSGCAIIHYKPFTRRKGKRGIKTVSLSAGTFIATGVGAVGHSISYAEFAKGKFPGEKE